MRITALDDNGDWTRTFKTGLDAFAQDCQTSCLEILGDCWFAVQRGIDWFNLLQLVEPAASPAIDFALRATLMNVQNAVGINAVSLTVDDSDVLDPIYEVQSAISAGNQTNGTVTIPSNALLDELGDILTTEDGTPLGV